MDTEQIMALAMTAAEAELAWDIASSKHPDDAVFHKVPETKAALQAAIQALVQERDDATYAGRLVVQRCDRLVQERDFLITLVAKVHGAKGRYHNQIAMAALYEACGLPFVKPVSGEKS